MRIFAVGQGHEELGNQFDISDDCNFFYHLRSQLLYTSSMILSLSDPLEDVFFFQPHICNTEISDGYMLQQIWPSLCCNVLCPNYIKTPIITKFISVFLMGPITILIDINDISDTSTTGK